MTNETNLKSEFSDIIETTKYRTPNYDEILFDEYLRRKLSQSFKFIADDIIRNIRFGLIEKYSNDSACFREYGVLSTLKIVELMFYQLKVGINGPQKANINDPVYVINKNGQFILYNGYHRILVHLTEGLLEIDAYVLIVNI
ncbi:hypothetical protein Palpr_2234 [Paludibacter propionicigenes WB4]|uniref:Uncharacterized protein n=1 Tax=Paludibacter propionicigenes (strain DSM 17365 / JCM 13257 / WB4) TaxID=694427 RepID=E4T6M6_PALPW|nr:hypothetical protein [Paludibacter propionicigenes]ADQ80370.1 hypothetical protein Palpr_2234 [Paludibacter propionicigenes WB4]